MYVLKIFPGAFGLVCMGTARGVEGYSGPTTVAIKQLKSNADEIERREFLGEMNIMKQVEFFTWKFSF